MVSPGHGGVWLGGLDRFEGRTGPARGRVTYKLGLRASRPPSERRLANSASARAFDDAKAVKARQMQIENDGSGRSAAPMSRFSFSSSFDLAGWMLKGSSDAVALPTAVIWSGCFQLRNGVPSAAIRSIFSGRVVAHGRGWMIAGVDRVQNANGVRAAPFILMCISYRWKVRFNSPERSARCREVEVLADFAHRDAILS